MTKFNINELFDNAKQDNKFNKEKSLKETLIYCVTSMREHSNYMDGINKALKCCDLIGIDDKLYSVIGALMEKLVTPEGYDLITWWLYEDVDHKLYSVKTDEVLADLNKIEDLVEYIIENYINK